MLKSLAVAAALAALTATGAAAEVVKGEWTGYITDTHCGKHGAGASHTAGCVEKCMKGGSKAQVLNEADGKIYDLDSFDKVKTLVGKKVTVKGSLDTEKKTIAVESASAATSK
jgi:hypothetical protein